MIKDDDDFELVGVAADWPDQLASIEAHDPEVVVTDVRRPHTGTDEGLCVAPRRRP